MLLKCQTKFLVVIYDTDNNNFLVFMIQWLHVCFVRHLGRTCIKGPQARDIPWATATKTKPIRHPAPWLNGLLFFARHSIHSFCPLCKLKVSTRLTDSPSKGWTGWICSYIKCSREIAHWLPLQTSAKWQLLTLFPSFPRRHRRLHRN